MCIRDSYILCAVFVIKIAFIIIFDFFQTCRQMRCCSENFIDYLITPKERKALDVYKRQYGYIPAGNLPLEDIVFNYRAYGLPCFETIRRARQRVQFLFPEYSRNPQKEEQSGSISIVINIS